MNNGDTVTTNNYLQIYQEELPPEDGCRVYGEFVLYHGRKIPLSAIRVTTAEEVVDDES